MNLIHTLTPSHKPLFNSSLAKLKRLFTVLSLSLVFSLPAAAYDFEVDGIYYDRISSRAVSITYKDPSYNSYSSPIVIPETVSYNDRTYSVTSIGDYAFSGCSSLTSITIPNSVTSIGNNAFFWCETLSSVTVGSSVASIGEAAFFGCLKIKEVHISDLQAWCDINFYDSDSNPCSSAKNLYLNGELLTDLVIPNSVKTIKPYAFSSCAFLTSIDIPNSVTSIGNYSFYNCSALSSISIGNSVISIDDYAFSWCSSLTSITIPNSVTSIGDNAFSSCSSITSITIGNSVTAIGSSAFSRCYSLRSIILPNSVTSIGDNAFYEVDLSQIKSLATIPPAISYGSFSKNTYNSAIVTVPDESLSAYQSAWSGFRHLISDTQQMLSAEYTLTKAGSLVNQIDLSRVEDYDRLKVNGPVNGTDLLTINKMVRLQYLDLSNATIVSGGMNYYDEDNKKFGTSDNVLGTYCIYNLSILKEFQLPENLIKIDDNAFCNCLSLTSISIPSSVTSIGKTAFDGCSTLKEVHISDLQAWCDINFYDSSSNPCSNAHNLYLNGELLTDLAIPNSVKMIRSYAFIGCSSLTSIDIPNSVITIGHSAFFGCSSLSSVTIPNSVFSIGNYVFSGCSSLTSIDITTSVKHIGDYAFSGCSSLISMFIPASIGNYAFNGCSSLSAITISNSVYSIGNNAFNGCTSIKDIRIEDGSETLHLGDYDYFGYYGGLFYNCPLENLYLGRNLSYWSNPNSVISPFSNKTTLKTVTIGKSVTKIGPSAFYRCSNLAELTIPGAVREIGANAFADCSALRTINMVNPIPAVIESNTFSSTVLNSATLNVPEDSKAIYWLHPYWGQFKSIALWNGGSDTEFDDDQLTMHVTSETTSTVEIASVGDTGADNIVVPETAELNGQTYTVDGVANNAFADSNVNTVVLHSTIAYVGVGAFSQCNKLNSLKINSILPPSVANESFDDSQFTTVSLCVPSEAVEAYKQHEVWGRFDIKGAASGIDDVEIDSDAFDINGEWQTCDIYNLQGIRLIHGASKDDFDALSPGYYLLVRDHSTTKVLKQ